jgi:hypothetical protein
LLVDTLHGNSCLNNGLPANWLPWNISSHKEVRAWRLKQL